MWWPVEKWGFSDSNRPFPGSSEMGVFRPWNPLFLILGILARVGGGRVRKTIRIFLIFSVPGTKLALLVKRAVFLVRLKNLGGGGLFPPFQFLAERILFAEIFIWAAGFFRRFSRRMFFCSFLWQKVPRKILRENPWQNPPSFILQKSPTHFCRGAGPTLNWGLKKSFKSKEWVLVGIHSKRFTRTSPKTWEDSASLAEENYRSSKWHYRQRKIIFELIMHFIADADTDENYLEFIFGSRYRDSCSLQPGGGGHSRSKLFWT